jgi:hypothetical protein
MDKITSLAVLWEISPAPTFYQGDSLSIFHRSLNDLLPYLFLSVPV